jgi:hypothetical protein
MYVHVLARVRVYVYASVHLLWVCVEGEGEEKRGGLSDRIGNCKRVRARGNKQRLAVV